MFPRNPAYTICMISIPFFAVLLAVLWCTAAKAAESTITVCTRRPLLQGKVGETVLVCETVRYKK